MNWPNDADGDVLRRMQDRGFDFSKKYNIDFNVDFDEWPPSGMALAALRRAYPSAKTYGPEEGGRGYIQFQIFDEISYDLVVGVQRQVSDLMAPYNGFCDSWGILHD